MGHTRQDVYMNAQMLIAMPNIGDPRFDRAVIYICAHSQDGAMGIVVNKSAEEITFPQLLQRLEIIPKNQRIELKKNAHDIRVHFGGPVETSRGFVLHSTDYYSNDNTLPIDDDIGLTATLDVLRAMATGDGPGQVVMALGYAGWGPGQLEQEIQSNGWLHCEPDESLLFGLKLEAKYGEALKKIGIDPGQLASQSGHA